MTENLEGQEAEDFKALCMAIGFVVVNWSLVEQQIDNWVNVCFLNCGGRALRKKGDIPTSFRMKVTFLKECFKKIDRLNPFTIEGLGLLGRAKNLSTERHDLVHSSLMSLVAVEGAFQFRRVEYQRENHAVSYFTFDPTAFSKLETALGNLITEQLAFSQKLADTFLNGQE